MTIKFPDVSQYTPNVDVSSFPIVIARATLSTSVADKSYYHYRDQSGGKVFVAYHWLNHTNIQQQAKWAFDHVGPNVPLMIDAEDVKGNTGYTAPLSVSDIIGFAAAYRSLGGIVHLCYLPHWYWQNDMGSPSLSLLSQNALHLVSSNYTTYSDTGPGWNTYGGVAPEQWQYTSTPYDMNAYRGTVDQYRAMVFGSNNPIPVPTRGDDLVNHWATVKQGDKGLNVSRAQGVLIANGLPVGSKDGKPDGDFGPTTASSTKTLQDWYHISVDAEFGPHTMSVGLYGHDYA